MFNNFQQLLSNYVKIALKSVLFFEDFSSEDKVAGVVILNKHDYISKMDTLLYDASKFENLGPAGQNDNRAKIESQMQRRLLEQKEKNLIPARVYEAIRPTGPQRSCMHGLPKTHKKDVLLRPILSMTGSANINLQNGSLLSLILYSNFFYELHP